MSLWEIIKYAPVQYQHSLLPKLSKYVEIDRFDTANEYVCVLRYVG